MEKMRKWLMVMEADSLETVHQKWLKLLKHAAITFVQFPIKWFVKWMHGFEVMAKTNLFHVFFCFKAFYNFDAWHDK